jgi:hypothetical protein
LPFPSRYGGFRMNAFALLGDDGRVYATEEFINGPITSWCERSGYDFPFPIIVCTPEEIEALAALEGQGTLMIFQFVMIKKIINKDENGEEAAVRLER